MKSWFVARMPSSCVLTAIMYAMSVELEGGCRVATMREGVLGSMISLRIVDIAGEQTFANEAHDEVLYDLANEEGIYIPAGASLTLNGHGTYVSSLTPATPSGRRIERLKLADQPRQKTADRWYAELVQAEVTQFVGSIPPGRAPDHFHLYEEVICILAGEGVMWAGSANTAIRPGSCIFLPRGQVHCVENRGS